MKTTQLSIRSRNGNLNRVRPQPGPGRPNHHLALSPLRTDRTRIQWPTQQQLQDVSKQLLRISREGKRCELAGDYFKSGDLAFQLRDIMRSTAELLRKSERTTQP